MPRKRHVSRNVVKRLASYSEAVMPRKRHVSRNYIDKFNLSIDFRHASQEACE